MTNKVQPLTKVLSITLLVTILFTGALGISPYAFSTGSNHDDDDDDDHDDCDDNDCEPDPCDCKKPNEFTVSYQGPGTETNPAVVEIYKKTDEIDDKDPLVSGIEVYESDDPLSDSDLIVVTASDFGKKKLGSNIGYRILWDIPGDEDADGNNPGLVEIARIDIHTSCSQLLYIGQTFTDGDVTLTVEDGKRDGKTSIPISNPQTCEAEPDPTPKATIILKKAVTTDNGAELVMFTPRIDGVQKEFDVPIEVDAGVPHMISEDPVDGFSQVLIAGDTGCPAMLDENFVLKKGEEITCTIYNDDDFDSSQTGGDGGIIFHRNSIIFTYMGQNNEVLDENGNSFDCSLGPCVELPPGTSTFIIHDMKVDRDSALVVMNVFPVVTLGNEDAFSDGCRVYRLATDTLDSTKLQFEFQCELIEPPLVPVDGMSLGLYRINYAVIDTDMVL